MANDCGDKLGPDNIVQMLKTNSPDAFERLKKMARSREAVATIFNLTISRIPFYFGLPDDKWTWWHSGYFGEIDFLTAHERQEAVHEAQERLAAIVRSKGFEMDSPVTDVFETVLNQSACAALREYASSFEDSGDLDILTNIFKEKVRVAAISDSLPPPLRQYKGEAMGLLALLRLADIFELNNSSNSPNRFFSPIGFDQIEVRQNILSLIRRSGITGTADEEYIWQVIDRKIAEILRKQGYEISVENLKRRRSKFFEKALAEAIDILVPDYWYGTSYLGRLGLPIFQPIVRRIKFDI